MTASSYASFFFFCLFLLLLPPQHDGASSHVISYNIGSTQVFFKTPGKSSGNNSQQVSTVPPASTCSSIATGSSSNKLLVVHRQSPCSPLYGLPSLTAADVLRGDAFLIRRRFSSQSSLVVGPDPLSSATKIPANNRWDLTTLPIVLDYSVLVGYGTPEQRFPVFLDTSSVGASLLRCKPCTLGSNDCDPAFDTSRSSTFSHILCGSSDCPTNCSVGSFCPLDGMYSSSSIKGWFVEDTLTLSPSMAIHDFRFFCMDVDGHDYLPEAGRLDLSMNRNSLPSQLSSSRIAPAATFSYCLPPSWSSQGFLYFGSDNATVRDNNVTTHAPLVINRDPKLAGMYFIDLVGISLGGKDLPIPAGTFGNNGANLDVWTTFTMLTPDAYKPLRDSFEKLVSGYNNLSSSGFDGFDTCFNFTGLDKVGLPYIEFKFSNGESLLIGWDPMLYYDDPVAAPFTMTCLAFSSLDAGYPFSAVIGTHTLASMEVVYDVSGGKVGFIRESC